MTMHKMTGTAVVGGLVMLAGCGGGFFIDNTGTGTTGGSSSTGNYVYVANQTADTLAGFSLATGGLTAVPGSPVVLASGLVPSSVVVTRQNTYVYVGGNGAISCYSIGTGGALTAQTNGGGSATANFVSMETSPDGQWLLGLDTTTSSIYVYKINLSNCALTLNSTTTYGVPGQGVTNPRAIRMAPSAAFVAVALGPGGDVVFTFNTSTGVLTQSATITLLAGFSDNAVAFDGNSAYLYVARGLSTAGAGSPGISSYVVNQNGTLVPSQALAGSGNAPYALTFDSTGTYLYAANRGDGTISGYTAAKGTLTALGSSPYASGSLVGALVADKSGKYLVAASFGGSSDVTLYSQDALTPGKLDAVAVSAAGAGTSGSVALAGTH